MVKKILRGTMSMLAVLAVAGTLAGCGKSAETNPGQSTSGAQSAQTSQETKAPDEKVDSVTAGKDSLIIATANETPSVTTNMHNAVAGDYLNCMTHNGLFYISEDLSVKPALCESYEVVSDTEWIFHLKKGVKFHNGEEMTARDVKASLDLCKESPQVSQYGVSTGVVEIVDDYTVKITTDGPQFGLLADLGTHGNFILPADLIESGHDFNKEPIGTGPYRLTAWNKGESLEFEAFEDYWGGEPAIKHISWRVIPEGSSRTMALETGEVDLIIEVETTDFPRLVENPDITTFSEAGTSHNWMMINNEKAPFDNINFRRAIASCIDKEAVIQVALSGTGSVSDSMVPDCFQGVVSDGAPGYDVEQAKAYFAESGLNPADCGFALICSDDTKLRVGQVIQSCIKDALGIDITLESMDLATYLDVTAEGDYQAAIGGYTSSTLLSYVQGVYHSQSIGGSNKTRINDPEVDSLIEKIQSTLDQEENTKVVTELSKTLNELCPQIPLYLRNNVRAYRNGLQGFNLNAGGNTYYEFMSWGSN